MDQCQAITPEYTGDFDIKFTQAQSRQGTLVQLFVVSVVAALELKCVTYRFSRKISCASDNSKDLVKERLLQTVHTQIFILRSDRRKTPMSHISPLSEWHGEKQNTVNCIVVGRGQRADTRRLEMG